MEVPRHWRMRKIRYQLQGEVCPNCDAKVFPPRPVCPSCGHGLVQRQDALPLTIRLKESVSINR